jgi:hypothetical protein
MIGKCSSIDLPAFLAQAEQADMGRVMRLLRTMPQNG